jgi:hypothetical protein
MIDMLEGAGISEYEKSFEGKIFWGALKPGESLEGSNKIWLLATPIMFTDMNYYSNP